MNRWRHIASGLAAFFLLALVGCKGDPSAKQANPRKEMPKTSKTVKPDPVTVATKGPEKNGSSSSSTDPPDTPKEAVSPLPPSEPPKQEGWKRAPLGAGVWLEVQGDKRRVLVLSAVCLRGGEYGLECLLCRKNTKEHESILATDADARLIHTALELAKAQAGTPVEYQPKFKAPTGPPIKVSIMYDKQGQTVTVPAQQWVRNLKTKKDLEHDWVFAGSYFFIHPETNEKLYAANGAGAYIGISNDPAAMLDLPIDSPKDMEFLAYVPHTQRIPAEGTYVTVIFEPKVEAKK